MEFSDISKDTPNINRHRKTQLYENTTLTVATIETDETNGTDQAEREEENYEQLNFDSKANNEKRGNKENTQNRNKIMVFVLLVMLVLLYIAVIVLIVIVALPKSQVHGGWSNWNPWGSCSVSCDIGVQRRDRSCNNPYPSRFGDHCYGDSRDDRLCMPGACADGGWSSWGSWGPCSESCGGGIKTRLRSCSNPRPSLLGRSCDGSSDQVILCNRSPCSDGGWSGWGSWGSCSESCGAGMKTRLRTCSNPRPSLLGRGCDGSSDQVVLCNKSPCANIKVAFTAYGSGTGSSSTSIKFPSTHFNSGGAYSTSTGRFTCKIPGIYHFAVTLTKKREDIDIISAYVRINGSNKLQLRSDPYDDSEGHIDYGSYSLSAAGTFHLNVNDYVDVYGVPSYFYDDYKSFFTGFLVIPDTL